MSHGMSFVTTFGVHNLELETQSTKIKFIQNKSRLLVSEFDHCFTCDANWRLENQDVQLTTTHNTQH